MFVTQNYSNFTDNITRLRFSPGHLKEKFESLFYTEASIVLIVLICLPRLLTAE